MKCPKCGSHKLKYKVNKTKILTKKKQFLRKRSKLARKKRALRWGGTSIKKISEPRTNFEVECSKCGWEGEVK